MMNRFMQKILGANPWKSEWQQELTTTLQEAQTGLPVNMIVIIARESDVYAELLFLLSFLGLSLGSLIAYGLSMKGYRLQDLLGFPMAGFALGATLYSFRRFFLGRLAPKAIHDRVSQKARSQFYDHAQNLKDRITLIYFSELERRGHFLCSAELKSEIPCNEIDGLIRDLAKNYNPRNPLSALKPCLLKIGSLLRISLKPRSETMPLADNPSPVFIGATDRPGATAVPVLKGNKDIN
jgi:hypothetical protein